ncbi:MAG TPA: ATP-binding protein, partial [Burkholderiaceae bacterium]
ENEALAGLATVLAENPDDLARALADAALRLTGAHSAGLSLEDTERGEPVFRWVATAGEFARYLHGTMPRDFSPCGEVVARDAPVLMRDPVRVYPDVRSLHRPVHEVLLVPFHRRGAAVGTMWVVSHDRGKTFDREDLRLVRDLTRFAAAAVQSVGLVSRLREANEAKAAALAQTQARLHQLQQWFEQAPGFLAYLDGPGHVFGLANEAYCRLVGRRDLVGRRLADVLPMLHGQGFDALRDQAYASGRPYVGRDVEVTVQYGDGPPVRKYVDFVYQPVTDEDGRVRGLLVQGHESTDRHRAMAMLREADRRKDEFLAALAHEMRSPLSAISLSAQLIKRFDGESERTRARAAVIERQSAQLATLVGDITDVTAIRAGKIQLRVEPVTAQDVLGRALESCGKQLESKALRLETHVPDDPVVLEADKIRLTQVLVNLVNNAIKYTPAGGTVSLAVEPAPGAVRFLVRDTGIGLAPELLPRVFDLFMQAPAADRAGNAGLGIGLALVKQFVELHGGEVHAESDGPGRGSCFAVTLPRRDAAGQGADRG